MTCAKILVIKEELKRLTPWVSLQSAIKEITQILRGKLCMRIYLLSIFVSWYKHVNFTDICKEMKPSKLLWDDVMKGIKQSLFGRSAVLLIRWNTLLMSNILIKVIGLTVWSLLIIYFVILFNHFANWLCYYGVGITIAFYSLKRPLLKCYYVLFSSHYGGSILKHF